MRSGFPDGYLLKKHFKVKDKEAIFIEANVPGEDLDLGKVEFRMKYPQPKKLKQKKLDDHMVTS